MRKIKKINLYIILFYAMLPIGCSTNWHTYQYNNERTGYTTNPGIASPNILWKTDIGIQGYLNNSIIDKNIYVTSSGNEHNSSDKKDGIYCINKKWVVLNGTFELKPMLVELAFPIKRYTQPVMMAI